MSTLEIFNQRATCYCGAGLIEREFFSPDNPYSTPYTGIPEIKCPTCAANWRALSNDVFVASDGASSNVNQPMVFRPVWKFC